MIEKCRYISSVGMLKRLDDLKMIDYGDGISSPAHAVSYDFSRISEGKDGTCIYVKFQYIRYFIMSVLPSIPYKFILVTGDGDEVMPHELMEQELFYRAISDDRILRWYSTNCVESIHPKLSLIPIGVNFHSAGYVRGFSGWHSDLIGPLDQESMIQRIKDDSLPFHERDLRCYSNFHFSTYDKFGNPRKEAIEKLDPSVVFYEPEHTDRESGWINQSRHAFVISPMGHGLDCHRTWEALILGCMPVVKKSILDSMYEGLPVLIVDCWSEISEGYLRKAIDRFRSQEFDMEKITAKYWTDKIRRLE